MFICTISSESRIVLRLFFMSNLNPSVFIYTAFLYEQFYKNIKAQICENGESFESLD